MKKISKKIQVGTKVFVNNVWCEVTEINDTRVNFKLILNNLSLI